MCAQYEGEYKAGVMDGRGTYRFADGSLYVGEYKGGKREGRGVYRFSDGAVYEGEYKGGAMEGFGTYQYVDGRAEVGRYAGNVDVGEGVRWSADRTTCWRLNDGKVIEEISLETADRIARKLGKTRQSENEARNGGGQHAHRDYGNQRSVAGSGRRPASSSKGSAPGGGLSNFAPPHGGAGVVPAAPTHSSRKVNGSSRPKAADSNRSTASSHGGFKPPGSSGHFGNSAAARNPHSVVHSSSHRSTPGSRPASAQSRNPLGGMARPPNPFGGAQRPSRVQSASSLHSNGISGSARPLSHSGKLGSSGTIKAGASWGSSTSEERNLGSSSRGSSGRTGTGESKA